MREIEKLIGSKLEDVEFNVNGFTVLYFKTEDGQIYAVDLSPVVRCLGKETI